MDVRFVSVLALSSRGCYKRSFLFDSDRNIGGKKKVKTSCCLILISAVSPQQMAVLAAVVVVVSASTFSFNQSREDTLISAVCVCILTGVNNTHETLSHT